MTAKTLNPYPLIGKQLLEGLDEISKSLKPTSSESDLAEVIYRYIQPLYYQGTVSTQVEIEIKSVVYNIINAYNNRKILGAMFNYKQMAFVDMMLCETIAENTPINAIRVWLCDIENNITKANLTIDEQTPLLLSIVCGVKVYEYWMNIVKNPGNWKQFFQEELSLNYANIPFWLIACMEGALIGASVSEKGLIAPTIDIVSVEIVSSLIGALAIGSGKVIFKWVPSIQPIQLLGGFSEVIGEDNNHPLFKNTNNYCTNRRKCSNSGCTNTCVNQGCPVSPK
jgi:hypothetical protein